MSDEDDEIQLPVKRGRGRPPSLSIRLARFPFVRDLTGFDFSAQPSIDKAQA